MDFQMEALLKGNVFSDFVKYTLGNIQKNYGLKKAELEVLLVLSAGDQYDTPSAVAASTCLTRGHVSQAIDGLLKAGLIEGIGDEHDRRSIHYHLTDKATPLIEELCVKRDMMEEKLFYGISQKDMEAFHRIVEQMLINVKDIIDHSKTR